MSYSSLRLGILLSGSGSTANAIMDACNVGQRLHGKIQVACVITNNPKSEGAARAKARGIPTYHVYRRERNEDEFGDELRYPLGKHGAHVVGQYGWLPQTPANLIASYKGMMINQHPGPLDPGYWDFGGEGMFGRRVHAARLYFVRHTKHDYWTEVCSQHVAPDYDKGPLILTEKVDIDPFDNVESLRQKCLPVEYAVQIATLELFATNHVPTHERTARLIKDHEIGELTMAKSVAQTMYPKG